MSDETKYGTPGVGSKGSAEDPRNPPALVPASGGDGFCSRTLLVLLQEARRELEIVTRRLVDHKARKEVKR